MRSLPLLALALTLPLHADFSYKSTRKTEGLGGNRPPTVSTTYYKGDKLKIDSGTTATIVDFSTGTMTLINHTAKTITVNNFQDSLKAARSNMEAKIDVNETGQKKTVNGFEASEVIMTMEIDNPINPQMGKMRMEMDMWISRDVPGAEQLLVFYEKNAANFPWASMTGGGNQSMASAMADAQRKLASMHGIAVQQVIRMKPASGMAPPPAAPALSSAQSAQMDKARAQLQAMIAQGGPQAAMAQQALGRMGGMAPSGTRVPAAGGAMIEMTMDASDFSIVGIPDSVFAVPADYKKTN